MAKKKLPNYRARQQLLYTDRTTAESLIQYGDLYFDEGALANALDFYAKADHTAGLQKIHQVAQIAGDAFLLQTAAKALNQDPSSDDWEKTASRAIGLKKFAFARHALQQAPNPALSEELAEAIQAEDSEKAHE